MNKTELKVFLKGLANFYVVLMIIAFLPTPGKDCSPGRLVRCIIIYTIVSIVIFSAVYFWNRIRKGPDKRPDTCPVPDAKETKDDDLSISRFLSLRNMGACFSISFVSSRFSIRKCLSKACSKPAPEAPAIASLSCSWPESFIVSIKVM